MKSSHDLYELIHQLTRSEKRYVRIGLQRFAGEKDTIAFRLYDVIESQDEVDEASVKAHFTGEPCYRQFTRYKNYLYERLLDLLNDYHAARNARITLYELLSQIEVLHDKLLDGQALRRLKKARDLVEKFEMVNMEPVILQWERQLKRHAEPPARQSRILERLENDLQATRQYYEAFSLSSQRPEGQAGPAPPLPAAPSPDHDLAFDTQIAVHLTRALMLRRQGAHHQTRDAHRAAVEVWQAHPHQVAEHPERYRRAVSAFLFSCIHLEDHASFNRFLAELRDNEHLGGRIRLTVLCTSHNLQLLSRINRWELETALSEITEWQDLTDDPGVSASAALPSALNIAVLHFLADDFRTCNRWLRKVIEFPGTSIRIDLRELARMLQLVALWEMKEYELLPYLVRSAQRYIQRRRKLLPWENAWLSFLRRAVKAERRHPELLRELEERLGKLQQEEQHAGQTEMLFWVRSRLSGTTIREIADDGDGSP